MADAIYEIPAGLSGSFNQGYYGPKMEELRTNALIITPPSFRIPPATWQENAQLFTLLQNAAQNDDPMQRIQILSGIQTTEEDNQEATPLTFGYGPSQRVYGDELATIYTFSDRDHVRHQLRQRLNDLPSDWLVIRVDEKKSLWGTADEIGQFRGFSQSEIFGYNLAMDTGNGVGQRLRVAWADPNEANKGNKLGLPTKVNVNDIKNVMDIHLKVISDLNTRVVTLAFMGAGYNYPLNLAERDAYRAILVANPNLVNFTTAAGAPLTITSAAPAKINGQSGVTYTLSATGYPTTGQFIYVDMDAVSALETALGTPFETPETLVLTVV